MTIGANLWFLWLLLTVFLFVALFFLVPVKKIRAYLPFGIFLGVGLAVIVIWTFQFFLQYWEVTGDPVILGFTTLFTPLAWIPPTIIFAAYFPKYKRWYNVIGYVLLFAVGSMVVQYLLEQVGMWQSFRWNVLWTGLLATGTHTVLTAVLVLTKAHVRT
ncbi:hypothetical protein [Dethiobacter alkaliphilus]|uniref:Uncharacterized protein n=1 Tax=Dethiobacter alkaliphilus AHT 1 TaxID=555088 RepID=C0GJX7_DETAL|nr:hypothetical protein [Dethiobacter alkaliphilus]EEG76346.1 hypothetical protein DealDRAFT_2786 [Dethiobacter alkaliphilus AHT 1]